MESINITERKIILHFRESDLSKPKEAKTKRIGDNQLTKSTTPDRYIAQEVEQM